MPTKLSEVMKEMAETILRDPKAVPSSEAAHAALFLSSAAWNHCLRPDLTGHDYHKVFREFSRSNPKFWSELLSSDPEALLLSLRRYKERHYADDRRWIVVCGMVPGGKIHVEWSDEAPVPPPVPKKPSSKRRR